MKRLYTNVREKYELALNPIGSFIEHAVAEDSTESDRVTKDGFVSGIHKVLQGKEISGRIEGKFWQDAKETIELSRWKGGIRREKNNMERSQVNWYVQFRGRAENVGSLNGITG